MFCARSLLSSQRCDHMPLYSFNATDRIRGISFPKETLLRASHHHGCTVALQGVLRRNQVLKSARAPVLTKTAFLHLRHRHSQA